MRHRRGRLLPARVRPAFRGPRPRRRELLVPDGRAQQPVEAKGQLGATELLAAKKVGFELPKVDFATPPRANEMAKKPDDMAKRLPGEKIEEFPYILNDTDEKTGELSIEVCMSCWIETGEANRRS